jgi:hypothetical protein
MFNVTIWRAACEACSAVQRGIGYKLGICTGTKENHKNLDQVGRSQDLPDAK